MYVLERLIDMAARRHGFDRVQLRRRNLVPPGAMPYRNPMALLYDSGDYPAALDRVLTLADWKGFEDRRAEITVRPDGRIDVVIGTLSSGQGHETSFAQLLVEWFGVELAQVRLITGDTDVARVGGGSHSGRSMRQAGVVMAKASDAIIQRGTGLAAWPRAAAAADCELAAGGFAARV